MAAYGASLIQPQPARGAEEARQRGQAAFESFGKIRLTKNLPKITLDFMKAVQITLKAHKNIAKLNKQDLAFIYEALEALKDWPDVNGVKNLADRPGYRLRIGPYRALFEITGDTLTVTEIKRRNEHTY